MLYQAYVWQLVTWKPIHEGMKYAKERWMEQSNPFSNTMWGRTLAAGFEIGERVTHLYDKPIFGINEITVNRENIKISLQAAAHKPYCNLLHFQKESPPENLPKLLMVAPLSGHYATLLRETVKYFLPRHEVYITDWLNPRDVPVSAGPFHLDDYISYLCEFIHTLGKNTHIVAVCQPGVPALVATAWLAMNSHEIQPKTLTLMGAPIDPRINATVVGDYATSHSLAWFKKNLIFSVPFPFKGQGQRVYPGFLQLAAFASMNWQDHLSRQYSFFNDLVLGNEEAAEIYRKFYDEYWAVFDLPAEYFLDTLQKVFQEFALIEENMTYRGAKIDLKAIENIGLMTVEGELDDITGQGQTKIVHELCPGIPAENKFHYLQRGVGHFGTFSGSRFRRFIGPRIEQFIRQFESPEVVH